MIEILDRLGIRYRILGCRERCTGDPARRTGEEGLFQQCARENIETLAGHSVKTVLTHCPHCFNTMKNEYPEFGASFSVEHHSQFLARMISEGRLSRYGRARVHHLPRSLLSGPRQRRNGGATRGDRRDERCARRNAAARRGVVLLRCRRREPLARRSRAKIGSRTSVRVKPRTPAQRRS